MSARPLILCLVIFVVAVTAAVIIFQRPHYPDTTMVSADGHPEVNHYAQEFADALSVTTHWNTGEPLFEPHFYFPGGDTTSPDGRFTLHERERRDYYHEITLSRGQAPPETVLVIQESSPGSGASHNCQWSRDSKAIFIYGSGTLTGHPHMNTLALIYMVEQRTLYAIELSQHLSDRLKAETNAPNPTLQRSATSLGNLPRGRFGVFLSHCLYCVQARYLYGRAIELWG